MLLRRSEELEILLPHAAQIKVCSTAFAWELRWWMVKKVEALLEEAQAEACGRVSDQ